MVCRRHPGLRVKDAPLKRKRAFCEEIHLPSPFIQYQCFTFYLELPLQTIAKLARRNWDATNSLKMLERDRGLVNANVDWGERVHVLLVDDPQESNGEASRLATSSPEPRRHELEVAEGIGDESDGMGMLHGCSRGDLDADDVAVIVVLVDDD